MTDYQKFLQTKRLVNQPSGIETDVSEDWLLDFQQAITKWSLKLGRAGVFTTCGTGKTRVQLAWCDKIADRSLIIAPLCVGRQTAEEGQKVGIDVKQVRHPEQMDRHGIHITNYEMAKYFAGIDVNAIALDESSILASLDGKTRTFLLKNFLHIPNRLCCTATPARNNRAELGNHAEFLGVMTREQMLSSFFVNESNKGGWRLRGHAQEPFWRWLASWAMFMNYPSDLGFDDNGFILPKLNIHDEIIETDWNQPGRLFSSKPCGVKEFAEIRRKSSHDRLGRVIEITEAANGQVIIWNGLNDEADLVEKSLSDCRQVKGTQSINEKEDLIIGFINGDYKTLITKPRICGFGMNFQNSSTQIWNGIGPSYEQYYQGIRREWRFGQTEDVDVHIVVTNHETDIVEMVRRKEREADEAAREIINAAKEYEMDELRGEVATPEYSTGHYSGKGWEIVCGDSAEEIPNRLKPDSVGLSVYSPPFLSLYQYSNTERDLGNSKSHEEFFRHYRYIIEALMTVTMPGRLTVVHVSQVPAMKVRDGYIGMHDFRGQTILAYQNAGWIFHGEATIDKCPQAQAIRIRALGLAFSQLDRDSAMMRPALTDHLLLFRKPGTNNELVKRGITNETWIKWARGVWAEEIYKQTGDMIDASLGSMIWNEADMGNKTLNTKEAKDNEDDRHICALGLPLIERAIRLWSNESDLIASPFAGIGSEVGMAVKLGRHGWGCELKPLYAKAAAKNCKDFETMAEQPRLF